MSQQVFINVRVFRLSIEVQLPAKSAFLRRRFKISTFNNFMFGDGGRDTSAYYPSRRMRSSLLIRQLASYVDSKTLV